MPSTEDRQQTPAWSERRPGQHANNVFRIELDFRDIESLVEKSGTGMRAEARIGSGPWPGLLTCFTQCRFDLAEYYLHSFYPWQDCHPDVRKPIRH